MDDLVERLCQGEHQVEVKLRPEKTPALLKEQVDRGVVHIRFPNTRGGTELGVRIDKDSCDLADVDFDKGTGTMRLVGGLTLNYVKVRCIAKINLGTFAGTGHLEVVNQ